MSAQRAEIFHLPAQETPRRTASTGEATREAMFLQSMRDDGKWAAVPTETIRKVVESALAARGEEEALPEYIVELDLIYWADKGEIKPVRYYCKRWRWSRKRVHTLLVRSGFLPGKEGKTRGQEGDNEGTRRGQRGDKKPAEIHRIDTRGDNEGTRRGQRGDNEGTVYTDSDSYSDSEDGGARPPTTTPKTMDEEPDAEQRAFNTRYGFPDRPTVVAYCVGQGIPEDAASEIWRYYQKVGWRLRNGLPIGDWRIAVADNYREHYTQLSRAETRPKTRDELLAMLNKDPNVFRKHRIARNTASGEEYFFLADAPLPRGFAFKQ